MADGKLNGLDKEKARDVLLDVFLVTRRYHEVLITLFIPVRWERITGLKCVVMKESLQPGDEEECSRGIFACTDTGELGVYVGDPFLFIDPQRTCDPLTRGPTISLIGNIWGRDFELKLLYNMFEKRWILSLHRDSAEPYVNSVDTAYSEEEVREYEQAIARFNRELLRLELPDAWTATTCGGQEIEVVLDADRAEKLVHVFYDICDAYFAYENICEG